MVVVSLLKSFSGGVPFGVRLKKLNYYLYSERGAERVKLIIFSTIAGITAWKALKVTFLSGFITKFYREENIKDDDFSKIIAEERLTRPKSSRLDFFYTNQLEPFCFGGCRPWKARIGLPSYFKYNSVQDIEQALADGTVKVGKWNLKLGENDADERRELAESLYLSEDAKSFAIQSQLETAYGSWWFPHLIDAGLFATFAITAAAGSGIANSFTRVGQKGKRMQRLAMYALIWGLAGFGYSTLVMTLNYKFYHNLDKKVAKWDVRYLNGGLELTEQSYRRNKLLMHVLPEKQWKSVFSDEGNVKKSITAMSDRIVHMKMLCRDRIEIE